MRGRSGATELMGDLFPARRADGKRLLGTRPPTRNGGDGPYAGGLSGTRIRKLRRSIASRAKACRQPRSRSAIAGAGRRAPPRSGAPSTSANFGGRRSRSIRRAGSEAFKNRALGFGHVARCRQLSESELDIAWASAQSSIVDRADRSLSPADRHQPLRGWLGASKMKRYSGGDRNLSTMRRFGVDCQ